VKVLFDKSTWYGGVITSVLKGGSRIKIKYGDGDVEESDYPDEDIIIDDISSGKDSDELYSAENMDIDDESTTMDFQDDAGTTDWNVEEDEVDEEEAATSEETQVESVSSPQRLVPLDSLVTTINGRDWVEGETSQETFTQDDDAVNWSLDDMSAHSSVNSRDRQKKRQETNQSSDDDLSTNSSIISGEKQQNLLEESTNEAAQLINGKALINDPQRRDTSEDDDFGYTLFEVDDNSVGNRLLDSSDDLGAGDSDYSPIEEDNNTNKSALDNRNQVALLLQSSRTVQEVSTSQQAIPEYLKTLRRRVGARKVNMQMDNDTTIGTLPHAVAHDIEAKRGKQQKDTGDESGANILASLSSASPSQKPYSQNDYQDAETALMMLASSHSGKDEMGSKDTQTASKILTSLHKRPYSNDEQHTSPKRPRLAESDAATTLLSFAKRPIRLVVSTEVKCCIAYIVYVN